MALTIQKRGRRHTATVRYPGICVSSTFSTRLLAEQWADRLRREIEHCQANGLDFDPEAAKATSRVSIASSRGSDPSAPTATRPSPVERLIQTKPYHDWTLARVAEEYLKMVTTHKKSYTGERNRIRCLQKSILGKMIIWDITAEHVYNHIQKLRHHRSGAPLANQSIRNTAYLISSIFEQAKLHKFQGGFDLLGLENPVRLIQLPPPSKSTKQRYIDPDILAEFFRKLESGRSTLTEPLAVFMRLAVQTGMRRSELIGLKWQDLRQSGHGLAIYLPDTKSGYPRTVYLNDTCSAGLEALAGGDPLRRAKQRQSSVLVFNFTKDFASHKFREIMTDIGYPEIRLHDLRHTALSCMANAGLTLKELMTQSGHRTATVASRYLHVDEKTIREKLSRMVV